MILLILIAGIWIHVQLQYRKATRGDLKMWLLSTVAIYIQVNIICTLMGEMTLPLTVMCYIVVSSNAGLTVY